VVRVQLQWKAHPNIGSISQNCVSIWHVTVALPSHEPVRESEGHCPASARVEAAASCTRLVVRVPGHRTSRATILAHSFIRTRVFPIKGQLHPMSVASVSGGSSGGSGGPLMVRNAHHKYNSDGLE